jgi:hypothetical protein
VGGIRQGGEGGGGTRNTQDLGVDTQMNGILG